MRTKTRIKLDVRVCAIKAAYDMEKRAVGEETRKNKDEKDRK